MLANHIHRDLTRKIRACAGYWVGAYNYCSHAFDHWQVIYIGLSSISFTNFGAGTSNALVGLVMAVHNPSPSHYQTGGVIIRKDTTTLFLYLA